MPVATRGCVAFMDVKKKKKDRRMLWTRQKPIASALVAIATAITPSATAATLVVGPAVGGLITHSTLQDAVNAAADGDTIVVVPGVYPDPTDMPHKRIIIAGSGSNLTTLGAIRPAPPFGGPIDTLVIRGAKIVPSVHAIPFSGFVADPPIHLNGGNALIVEDCVLDATTPGGDSPTAAVVLNGVLDAVFTRCTLRGANGKISVSISDPPLAADGAPALRLTTPTGGATPNLTLVDCNLIGGHGYDHTQFSYPGGGGGDGLRVIEGQVTAIASTFQGGDTGAGAALGGNDDGTGEPGAGATVEAGAALIHQSCSFASGVDVPPGTSPSPTPILLIGGTETPRNGTPALLTTSLKTPVGAIVNTTLTADPGAAAALLLGAPFPIANVPGVFGSLSLSPSQVIVLPTLSPAGDISFGLVVPPLPAGFSSATIAMQAYVVPTTSSPVALSNPSVVTVVVPGL